jgi:hypothetical protein
MTVFGSRKELPSLATPRLMRWAIFLTEYIKGFQNAISDTLSRFPVAHVNGEEMEEVSHYMLFLEDNCQYIKIDDIKRETKIDEILI